MVGQGFSMRMDTAAVEALLLKKVVEGTDDMRARERRCATDEENEMGDRRRVISLYDYISIGYETRRTKPSSALLCVSVPFV